MTDRELLELAARAAGTEVTWVRWVLSPKAIAGCAFQLVETKEYWNPLSDDGDAQRLAAACGMIIDLRYTKPEIVQYNRVEYWLKGAPENVLFFLLGVHHDPKEALRRCITRAAAEIGRAGTADGRG